MNKTKSKANENLKGKAKGKQGKTEQEEEKDFNERVFGGTEEEKTSKLKEYSLFGTFSPPQKTKTKANKNTKNKQKTPCCMLTSNPHFSGGG